jgi:hypothetical protein
MTSGFEGSILISLEARVYTSSGSSLVSSRGLPTKEAGVGARIELSEAVESRNFSLKARF